MVESAAHVGERILDVDRAGFLGGRLVGEGVGVGAGVGAGVGVGVGVGVTLSSVVLAVVVGSSVFVSPPPQAANATATTTLRASPMTFLFMCETLALVTRTWCSDHCSKQ